VYSDGSVERGLSSSPFHMRAKLRTAAENSAVFDLRGRYRVRRFGALGGEDRILSRVRTALGGGDSARCCTMTQAGCFLADDSISTTYDTGSRRLPSKAIGDQRCFLNFSICGDGRLARAESRKGTRRQRTIY
jgi:hypothetical protein